MDRQFDDTSKELIAAAHRLLASEGPDALTVRRIATEAGMSTMNVYSRFGGKDGVSNELYITGFTMLRERLDAVPTSLDIADELMESGRAYRQFALDHPEYYGVMLGAAISGFEPSAEASDHAFAALSGIAERVSRAHAANQFELDEGCEPIHVAAFLWAACHGVVSLELNDIAHELIDWPQVFDHCLRSTLSSFSAAPAA